MMGFWFFTTQFLPRVLGYSPFAAGLAFLPTTIPNFAAAMMVLRLTRRFGNARLLAEMAPKARVVAAFNTVPSEVLFAVYEAKRKATRWWASAAEGGLHKHAWGGEQPGWRYSRFANSINHMILKPRDVVVLLKLVALGSEPWTCP